VGHWSFILDDLFAWSFLLVGITLLRKLQVPLRLFKAGILAVFVLFFITYSYLSWKHFLNLSKWNPQRTELIAYLNTLPRKIVLVPEIWLETDVLIHTRHHNFLPRGAQSAVAREELAQRLAHAAQLLGYSKEGFSQWIHTKGVRFFGMLYATSREFASSYSIDLAKKTEFTAYQQGNLPPDVEATFINMKTGDTPPKIGFQQPDLLVLHRAEAGDYLQREVWFENDKFLVLEVNGVKTKNTRHQPIRPIQMNAH